MDNNDNTFHIGLCMAGAVSAGAYTAGVMDYLLEALDEWEKRKKEDPDNTPSHNVQIPVIGGASAGGMTGIITASLLAKARQNVVYDPANPLKEHPENLLYHAWVDLMAEDMFSYMLKTDDMTPGKVYSLLNSAFIEEVARKIIVKGDKAKDKVRPYFPPHIRLFATLSNLGGFTTRVPFSGTAEDIREYIITSHTDFACFSLIDNNEYEAYLQDGKKYGEDGWIPLNIDNDLNIETAISAAMATGAFPAGLRSRGVKRDKKYLTSLKWLQNEIGSDIVIDDPYDMLYVDGGMINNEPFDRVRQVLLEITGQGDEEVMKEEEKQRDYHTYESFKGTILMIDPFPSEPEKYDRDDHLFKVLGGTLTAMMNNLRIKPAEVVKAMRSDLAGQFLIAPTGPVLADGKMKFVDGAKAIACGSLGGFGGFFSKEFRIHDFYLGRANCEKFLHNHFTVPADSGNPIFDNGYAHIKDKSKFTSPTDKGLQIIPLFKELEKEIPIPKFSSGTTWPVIPETDIDKFKPALKKRTQAMMLNMAEVDAMTRALLWAGAKLVVNRKVADAVVSSVKSGLNGYNLLTKKQH